jgi:hypothetical protein
MCAVGTERPEEAGVGAPALQNKKRRACRPAAALPPCQAQALGQGPNG